MLEEQIMKKLVTICILIITMFILFTDAQADSFPLPEPNTDVEITFSDFSWYMDYPAIRREIKERGFTYGATNFSPESSYSPHWTVVSTTIFNAEKRCGGNLGFYTSLPKVAGYNVESINFYFLWNIDSDLYENYTDGRYKENDSALFYIGVYKIDAVDRNAAFKDLVAKMKKLYGDSPYERDIGNNYSCAYWVNTQNAVVGIMNGISLEITYMAPGGEERLAAVADAVAQKEVNDAQEDLSGL